jgi:hypothetical protein
MAAGFKALVADSPKPSTLNADPYTLNPKPIAIATGINALVAVIFLVIGGGSKCRVPISEIGLSGGTQMMAMASSNEVLI